MIKIRRLGRQEVDKWSNLFHDYRFFDDSVNEWSNLFHDYRFFDDSVNDLDDALETLEITVYYRLSLPLLRAMTNDLSKKEGNGG